MKKYIIEFVTIEGKSFEIEFETGNIEKTIKEYYRNRPISTHKVLLETAVSQKSMLLG